MFLLKAFIIVLLILICWEDMRHRAVHWSLFLELALCLGVQNELMVRKSVLLFDTVFNLTFVALQFLAVSLYFSLREGRWVNVLRNRMGPGDLLFLAICTLGFSRFNFIVFVVSGMCFSLLAYGVLLLVYRSMQRTVPTAGLLAAYMAAWVGLELSGIVGPLHSSIPMTALL